MTKDSATAHAERLLAAFGGDVSGWTWDGEIGEQDGSALGAVPCACGHRPIRYLYVWRHATRHGTVTTGCVCVEAVPGLDAASIARIRAHVEAARKRASAARRAQAAVDAQAEVVALRRDLDAELRRAYWRVVRWIETNGAAGCGLLLPDRLCAQRQGYRDYSREICHALKFSSPAATARRLRVLLEAARKERLDDREPPRTTDNGGAL